MPSKQVVAIIGRPNVGKSTLFNRLTGKRAALVSDMPGLTRDRREGDALLLDHPVLLVDTAGLEEAKRGSIAQRMREQSEVALREADLVLFVIDAREGVMPADHVFERMVRASLFSLSAVALTLLTTAADPWDERPREERLSSAGQPVAHTPFLGPAAVSEASGLRWPNAATDGITAQAEGVPREFYFSRVQYSGSGRGFRGWSRWDMDYPKADQIFLSFIDRLLSNLDADDRQFVVRLDDPGVRRFPFLYALEVGSMALTEPEIVGLRDYLLAGGFLVIDDFWGSRQWANWEYEIRSVLPGYEIVDLSLDHPIFTAFYEIDEILQVPNVRNGVRGGPTHQSDGYVPMVKGIHDENGRLMVVINWNTDLGDAWEWADNPYYPLKYSTYAYEMGVNFIVYAMSH